MVSFSQRGGMSGRSVDRTGVVVEMPSATALVAHSDLLGFGKSDRGREIAVLGRAGRHQVCHGVVSRASRARNTVTRFLPDNSWARIHSACASEHALMTSMTSRAVMAS